MKLLFDHNLSPVLVRRLLDLYPGSTHVYLIGLDKVDDRKICAYAINNDFIIVTKDSDYNDLYMVISPFPKIIWIRRGNCPTTAIDKILRSHFLKISGFTADDDSRILILY